MPNLTTETRTGQDTSAMDKKCLVFNGYNAIEEYTSYKCINGSLFLKESVMLFVTEGRLKIRHGNLDYFIEKNQMVFIKKEILVEYTAGNSESTNILKNEFILVSIKYDLVKEFTKMAELTIVPRYEVSYIIVNPISAQISKYIDSLRPYFGQPDKIKYSLIKIKLFELLFYLAAGEHQILEQILDIRERYISNITATVEENIMNPLSLNQLATLAGRSLSSFRRDFLAIYNMPPSQWIRKKRLEKAKELLQSTTMTVTDICYTLGFENIAHFSRLFKTQFGYPPSEYRTQAQIA